MTTAYPLQWPVGKPRTSYPKRSAFKAATLGRTRDELMAEGMHIAAAGIRHIGHNYAGIDGSLVASMLANIIDETAVNLKPSGNPEPMFQASMPEKVLASKLPEKAS